MAVRLRPQSSAWMAPHALAAQLTAQTGQIAGQGVAGLLGGIAQGVGAFTQARNRRQEMAINESRYKDALTRQDRSFQYGAAKDQASLLEDYMKGAEVEAALSAMSSPTGTPDPSKVQNLRTAQSSMNALRAQLAQIGGVQPANVPPIPEAPAPLTPTAQMPGVQERLAKLSSFEALSDEELGTVADGLAAEAEAIKAEMDAILKVGGTKGAAAAAAKRTAFAEKNREAMIAAGVLKRRQAKAESAQKVTEAEAVTRAREGVQAEFKGKADAAEAARLTADARSAGYKGEPFQTKDAALKWLEANKQINVMDVRNAFTALRDEKKAAILSAYREKTFGLKREALDLAQAKFELEKAGDASAASKADARLSKTWNDVADYAEQVLREYQFVTGAENLPEVQEARKLQAEAGRELIKLARDSMKPKTAAPSPAPVASDAPPSFVPPDMAEDWNKMTPAQKDKVKQAFGGG